MTRKPARVPACGRNNEAVFDNSQLRQQHNHPIELYNRDVILHELHYLHENPVQAGFVEKAEDWLCSSAGDYEVREGLLEGVILTEF